MSFILFHFNIFVVVVVVVLILCDLQVVKCLQDTPTIFLNNGQLNDSSPCLSRFPFVCAFVSFLLALGTSFLLSR